MNFYKEDRMGRGAEFRIIQAKMMMDWTRGVAVEMEGTGCILDIFRLENGRDQMKEG